MSLSRRQFLTTAATSASAVTIMSQQFSAFNAFGQAVKPMKTGKLSKGSMKP